MEQGKKSSQDKSRHERSCGLPLVRVSLCQKIREKFALTQSIGGKGVEERREGRDSEWQTKSPHKVDLELVRHSKSLRLD